MLGFYLFVLCMLERNWCRECGKLHLVFLVGGLGLLERTRSCRRVLVG